MAVYTRAGVTRRLSVKSLTHLDTGDVTSGATVTFVVTQSGSTAIGPLSGSASGNDWSADITTPAVGVYEVLATVTAGGATEEFVEALVVRE